MRTTLCGYKVIEGAHPDHKLREASLCPRCSRIQDAAPANTEYAYTKTGSRRHYTLRVTTL